MIEKVKGAFSEVNWTQKLHSFLLLIFAFYISLAIIGCRILFENKVSDDFITVRNFFVVSGILSLIGFSTYLIHYLKVENAYKVIWGYVSYTLVSYFLLVTHNINNHKFKIFDFGKNQFFEYRGLVIVLFSIILAFIIKYIVDTLHLGEQFNSFFQDYYLSESPIYYLIIFLVVSDNKLIANISPSLANENVSDFIKQIFISSIITFAIFYFIIKLTFRAFEAIKNNKINFSLAVITSVFFALIFNYTIQLGIQENTSPFGAYILKGATLYQVSFISVFFIFLYLLINRYIPTTIFIIVLGTIISFINYLKGEMRSEPLLITDFTWIKEPAFLISFVDSRIIIVSIILLLLIIGLIYFFRKKIFKGKIFEKERYCVSISVVLLILIFGIYTIFKNEKDNKIVDGIPVISKLNNDINIAYMGANTNAQYKSLMYVWTKQLTKKVMETPDNYSKKAIEEIVKKYTDLSNTTNQTRSNDISNQTVIYILSESLANPTYVDGVSVSTDVLSNINGIKNSTTSGIMHSDGYGGGTANMEFQTLTGLPYTNYSKTVSTLYTEVFPKLSNVPSISNLFESSNRYVIHPSAASNYSRNAVYTKLGFKHQIFLDGGTETFSNDKKTGAYMSDEAVYDEILSKIDTSKDQFFSVITMQNHAPWAIGFPEEVVATGEGFTDEENTNLTEYARLLSQTDSSTSLFLSKLAQIDKDISVVFYGDHLPGLYPNSAFSAKPESKYQTDYFIWSNHHDVKLDYPYVSSSDFTAELLTHTNSKISPYYALLTCVLENKNTPDDQLSDAQKQVEEDLKLIQYDISIGKNYVSKYNDFFKIK
ncbi:LTA synthase family protein [Streptococcus equinus]|uniref:LTA synthase family protein n=1 Tax=Streptococcus equinus TaxID=1335 RepID=UPI003B5A6797